MFLRMPIYNDSVRFSLSKELQRNVIKGYVNGSAGGIGLEIMLLLSCR